MLNKYSFEIESDMQNVYYTLNEKDRRKYAAIEAKKLGYGGIAYISRVLGCDRETIRTGINELKNKNTINGIRKKGGGRKRCINTIENIDEIFLDVVKDNTAGDPMDDNILWTNLTQKEISKRMKKRGIDISVTVVKQLLAKHRYVKRKSQKKVQ